MDPILYLINMPPIDALDTNRETDLCTTPTLMEMETAPSLQSVIMVRIMNDY